MYEVQSRDNELRCVFRDGQLMIDEDLTQIRDRAASQLNYRSSGAFLIGRLWKIHASGMKSQYEIALRNNTPTNPYYIKEPKMFGPVMMECKVCKQEFEADLEAHGPCVCIISRLRSSDERQQG